MAKSAKEIFITEFNAPHKKSDDDSELIESVFNEAEKHYFGLEDYLVDEDEAYIWYQKAVKIGVAYANLRLGDICSNEENNNYNKKRAIKYYKDGASMNDPFCYIRLAEIYETEELHNNLIKCLSKFIEIIGFKDTFVYSNDSDRWEIGKGCLYCLEMSAKMDLGFFTNEILYSCLDSTRKCNSIFLDRRQAALASVSFVPARMRGNDENLHAAYPRTTIPD